MKQPVKLSSEIIGDEKPLTPPLKWAGGKRWLLPDLERIYRRFSRFRLVEPFVGGMAVALGLKPDNALLNDLNPHLINFYSFVKEGLELSSPMLNDREFFFEKRERFNSLVRSGAHDTREGAEIFYYLNRTAFNGLCRFNSKGEFNVPFGKYSRINYAADFLNYTEVFRRWSFTCGDFESLTIKTDDFLYVDPPYDVESTRYSQQDFTWADQQRLVDWLVQFKNPIVASNQATERVLKLYADAGFEITQVSGPRMISCKGDRQRQMEMLATRNL